MDCIIIATGNRKDKCQKSDRPFMAPLLQHDDAGDETRESSKQWGHAFRTFCETTTFHGLRNVVGSTSHNARRERGSCHF